MGQWHDCKGPGHTQHRGLQLTRPIMHPINPPYYHPPYQPTLLPPSLSYHHPLSTGRIAHLYPRHRSQQCHHPIDNSLSLLPHHPYYHPLSLTTTLYQQVGLHTCIHATDRNNATTIARHEADLPILMKAIKRAIGRRKTVYGTTTMVIISTAGRWVMNSTTTATFILSPPISH